MKNVIIAIACVVTAVAASAQRHRAAPFSLKPAVISDTISPRACSTGIAIDAAMLGAAVSVTVATSGSVPWADPAWQSDMEAANGTIPLRVWRARTKDDGSKSVCLVATLAVPMHSGAVQTFDVPMAGVITGDHVEFEQRSAFATIDVRLSRAGATILGFRIGTDGPIAVRPLGSPYQGPAVVPCE